MLPTLLMTVAVMGGSIGAAITAGLISTIRHHS